MVRSGFEKKINKIGIKKSGGKISGLKLSYIMNSFENSLEKLSKIENKELMSLIFLKVRFLSNRTLFSFFFIFSRIFGVK